MKFLVRLPNGAESEHELLATAVVGRDKASALVLDDNRCSRKHGMLEADGVTFRDLNSANGIFVNGIRTQTAVLKPGDIVLLGGTTLTVLAEEASGTMQMSAEEVATATSALPPPAPTPAPAPAPAPAASSAQTDPGTQAKAPRPERTLVPPVPAPAAPPPFIAAPPELDGRSQPISRPFTVTLLALGWGACAVLLPAAGLLAAFRGFPLVLLAATLLGIVSALLAYGLLNRTGWGRWGQVAAASAGLFTPLIVPSAAIIYYMMRDDVGLSFARRDYRELSEGEAEILRTEPREATFTAFIAASMAVSLLAAAAALIALRS